MGPGGFFPTNPELVDILGDTDFNFENLIFLDFCGSQIYRFPGPRFPNFQKSGLGHAWAQLGPGLGLAWDRLGPGLGPRLGSAWAWAWARLGPGRAWAQLRPGLGPSLGPGLGSKRLETVSNSFGWAGGWRAGGRVLKRPGPLTRHEFSLIRTLQAFRTETRVGSFPSLDIDMPL